MRAIQAALIAALLISCADDQTAPVEQSAVVGTNLTFLRLDARHRQRQISNGGP